MYILVVQCARIQKTNPHRTTPSTHDAHSISVERVCVQSERSTHNWHKMQNVFWQKCKIFNNITTAAAAITNFLLPLLAHCVRACLQV